MSRASHDRARFHLAIPVDDLAEARSFYGGVLGCPQGRESDTWVDWNLYGHQLVTHLGSGAGDRVSNPVDDHDVPVPHFGVLLDVAAPDVFVASLFLAVVTLPSPRWREPRIDSDRRPMSIDDTSRGRRRAGDWVCDERSARGADGFQREPGVADREHDALRQACEIRRRGDHQ